MILEEIIIGAVVLIIGILFNQHPIWAAKFAPVFGYSLKNKKFIWNWKNLIGEEKSVLMFYILSWIIILVGFALVWLGVR